MIYVAYYEHELGHYFFTAKTVQDIEQSRTRDGRFDIMFLDWTDRRLNAKHVRTFFPRMKSGNPTRNQ